MASAITSLVWVADGIDDAERQAVQGLVDIEVLFGMDSAPAMVNKPWVANGLDEHELTVIETLARLAERAEESAKQILTMAFLATLEPSDADTVGMLAGLAGRDRTLFNAVVGRPWIEDGVDKGEAVLLEKLESLANTKRAATLWITTFVDSTGPNSALDKALVDRYDVDESGGVEHAEALLAVRDYADAEINDDQFAHIVALYAFTEALIQTPQLMDLVMATGWYQDGIDDDNYVQESHAISMLRMIYYNPELTDRISKWRWLFDETLTSQEYRALRSLSSIIEQAPKLAHLLVSTPWLADDINKWEAMTMSSFRSLTEQNQVDFALELVTAPWVMDGVKRREYGDGIYSLETIVSSQDAKSANHQLGVQFLHMVPYPPSVLDLQFIAAMSKLIDGNPDVYSLLSKEPWFLDGLDLTERAYLIATTSTNKIESLFDPYTAETKVIELPLAGPVNLLVVGHDEFNAQHTLEALERAVQGSEELLQIPFPVKNVLLYKGRVRTRFVSYKILTASTSESIIAHEVGHYYFRFSPQWLNEGGANLVKAYIINSGNLPTPVYPDYCASKGLKKLQDLNELGSGPLWSSCRYSMGQHFLLILRNAMGEEAWTSAFRAYYLTRFRAFQGLSDASADRDLDELFYRVFLEHTPPELLEDVKDVFRRLHGGPFIDQEG